MMWNDVQLASGFEISMTYYRDVEVDGTAIGLDEEFDLTRPLALFLLMNAHLIRGRIKEFDSAVRSYRRHFRRELRHKREVMSYNFLETVYNSPQAMPELVKAILQTEKDSHLRDTVIKHEDSLATAYERLTVVSSSRVRTWWFLFWDDCWRRNASTISQLNTYAADFCPHYPKSIAYRPLPRAALEAFLTQRGLYGPTSPQKRFFHNGLLNKIYFRLNSIVFHGTDKDVSNLPSMSLPSQ